MAEQNNTPRRTNERFAPLTRGCPTPESRASRWLQRTPPDLGRLEFHGIAGRPARAMFVDPIASADGMTRSWSIGAAAAVKLAGFDRLPVEVRSAISLAAGLSRKGPATASDRKASIAAGVR